MSFREPLSFEAIGTKWWISISEDEWTKELIEEIFTSCSTFDQRFSRFIQSSELSKLNHKLAGQPSATEKISPELFAMLRFADTARQASNGAFEPNITSLLRGYGYDETYSFKRNEQLLTQPRGEWWLEEPDLLHTRGLVEIDSGGFGKGVLIDQLAAVLRRHSHSYFLIDGGGDMYATSKPDGSAWTIALQHPYDPDSALGTLKLKHCGFAASASTHRKVGDFHHILDPRTGEPIQEVVAVFCTGPTAEAADVSATALFVSQPHHWPNIQQALSIEYLVIFPNLRFQSSAKFLFSSS